MMAMFVWPHREAIFCGFTLQRENGCLETGNIVVRLVLLGLTS